MPPDVLADFLLYTLNLQANATYAEVWVCATPTTNPNKSLAAGLTLRLPTHVRAGQHQVFGLKAATDNIYEVPPKADHL